MEIIISTGREVKTLSNILLWNLKETENRAQIKVGGDGCPPIHSSSPMLARRVAGSLKRTDIFYKQQKMF